MFKDIGGLSLQTIYAQLEKIGLLRNLLGNKKKQIIYDTSNHTGPVSGPIAIKEVEVVRKCL